MLQTTQLRFRYNASTAFQFPDLRCAAGETLLVTGKSGRGKTTLLHLLGGLLSPQSGQIHLGKTDLAQLRGSALDHFRGQNIGIVFQQPHFVASLSVLDNVLLSNVLSGKKAERKTAESLLEQLGIADQAAKKPANLSIGQQQRANIARALLHRPQLLLADEPTSSLDDDNTHTVAQLLQDLASQHGAALVIVTHDGRLKSVFERQVGLE
jgi:ABC-type lipoprotein export system ATPase subunit